MNYYDVWFNLRPGTADVEFAQALDRWLGHLRAGGLLEDWHLARRMLGLGPAEFPEFHLRITVRDLAQLDAAFRSVARRAEPEESLHFDVNQHVSGIRFALYRPFPDPQREHGAERF